MIVPGGGISLDGERWVSCRPGFFLPVRVLSRYSGDCSWRSSSPRTKLTDSASSAIMPRSVPAEHLPPI